MESRGERYLRRGIVALAGSALLGWGAMSGCSLLYDISDLKPFVPEDVGPDTGANVDKLSITSLTAPPLEEGVGDGDSRPALLVLEGDDFEASALLEISSKRDDGPPAPVAGLTIGTPVISKTRLAAPVSVAASAELAGERDVPLVVTLSKRNGSGQTITAEAAWLLKGRFELDSPRTLVAEGVSKPYIFSKVEVTGTLTVQGTQELVVRSNSTFRLAGDLDLSASGKSAGVAGGAEGGAPAKAGAGPGGGSGGVGTIGADGGGAGYALAGKGGASAAPPAGDAQISSFESNRSSGGGGGGIVSLLGGAGGGGGGAIELSARGELAVRDLTCNGGAGASLLNGSGGGGSGGTIVLRGGTKVTARTLYARGGAGGAAGNANAGSDGRIRVDAAEVEGASLPLAVRGAMFDPATPSIVRVSPLPLRLIGIAGARFQLYSFNAADQSDGNPRLVDFQGASELTTLVTLRPGYNRLCTAPFGSSVSRSESTNCLEVAFIE